MQVAVNAVENHKQNMAEMKPPEGAGKGGGGAAGDGREASSGDWASIAAAVGQQAISMLVDGQPQAFVDFFYLACQREEGKECAARPRPAPPPRAGPSPPGTPSSRGPAGPRARPRRGHLGMAQSQEDAGCHASPAGPLGRRARARGGG